MKKKQKRTKKGPKEHQTAVFRLSTSVGGAIKPFLLPTVAVCKQYCAAQAEMSWSRQMIPSQSEWRPVDGDVRPNASLLIFVSHGALPFCTKRGHAVCELCAASRRLEGEMETESGKWERWRESRNVKRFTRMFATEGKDWDKVLFWVLLWMLWSQLCVSFILLL